MSRNENVQSIQALNKDSTVLDNLLYLANKKTEASQFKKNLLAIIEKAKKRHDDEQAIAGVRVEATAQNGRTVSLPYDVMQQIFTFVADQKDFSSLVTAVLRQPAIMESTPSLSAVDS